MSAPVDAPTQLAQQRDQQLPIMAKLADSAAWLELVKALQAHGSSAMFGIDITDGMAASKMLADAWNYGYNGAANEPLNLALHIAASEQFGFPGPDASTVDPALLAQAIEIYQNNGDGLRDYLSAIHEVTQDAFAAAGVDSVTVYRGVNYPPDADTGGLTFDKTPGQAVISSDGLTSYSTDPTVATVQGAGNYAVSENHLVFAETVPASEVFASPLVGFGQAATSDLQLFPTPGRETAYIGWTTDDFAHGYLPSAEDVQALAPPPSDTATDTAAPLPDASTASSGAPEAPIGTGEPSAPPEPPGGPVSDLPAVPGAPPGDIYQATWDYRDQVLEGVDAATAVLAQYYVDAFTATAALLDELAARIQAAQDAGEEVNPSWLTREGQLEATLEQIQAVIDQFSAQASQTVAAGQSHAAQLGVASAQAQLAALAPPGVDQQWGVPSDKALANTLGAAMPNSPLANLFDMIGPGVADILRHGLFNGIATGQNPMRVAAGLSKDVTDLSLNRAQVIARTEMLRSYRDAALMTYQENSDVVSGWVWLAGLSLRTCGFCFAQNGSVHAMDESMDSHQSCACVMLPLTGDWSSALSEAGLDASDLADAGIDPSLFEGEGAGMSAREMVDAGMLDMSAEDAALLDAADAGTVPEAGAVDMSAFQTSADVPSGEDVFAQQTADFQKAILGPSKYALYANGDLALSDLVGHTYDKAWGGAGYEKSLKELGFTPADVAAAKAAVAQRAMTPATHPAAPLPLSEARAYILTPEDRAFAAKLREQIGATGVADYKAAIHVGAQLHERVSGALGELGSYAQEAQGIRERAPNLTDEERAWALGDKAAVEAHGGVRWTDAAARYHSAYREQTLSYLRDIRALGGDELALRRDDPAFDPLVADHLNEARAFLPADWLAASNRLGDIAAVRNKASNSGGWEQDAHSVTSGDATIALSYSKTADPLAVQNAALHELIHRMETAVPQLSRMEQDFYRARAGTEQPVRLTNGIGKNTILDHYIDEYMGTEALGGLRPPYHDAQLGIEARTVNHYELLTVGAEMALGHAPHADLFAKDPEYAAFVLGSLAGVKAPPELNARPMGERTSTAAASEGERSPTPRRRATAEPTVTADRVTVTEATPTRLRPVSAEAQARRDAVEAQRAARDATTVTQRDANTLDLVGHAGQTARVETDQHLGGYRVTIGETVTEGATLARANALLKAHLGYPGAVKAEMLPAGPPKTAAEKQAYRLEGLRKATEVTKASADTVRFARADQRLATITQDTAKGGYRVTIGDTTTEGLTLVKANLLLKRAVGYAAPLTSDMLPPGRPPKPEPLTLRESLATGTPAQLKARLREAGLPTTGTPEELVARLANHVEQTALPIRERVYERTQLARMDYSQKAPIIAAWDLPPYMTDTHFADEVLARQRIAAAHADGGSVDENAIRYRVRREGLEHEAGPVLRWYARSMGLSGGGERAALVERIAAYERVVQADTIRSGHEIQRYIDRLSPDAALDTPERIQALQQALASTLRQHDGNVVNFGDVLLSTQAQELARTSGTRNLPTDERIRFEVAQLRAGNPDAIRDLDWVLGQAARERGALEAARVSGEQFAQREAARIAALWTDGAAADYPIRFDSANKAATFKEQFPEVVDAQGNLDRAKLTKMLGGRASNDMVVIQEYKDGAYSVTVQAADGGYEAHHMLAHTGDGIVISDSTVRVVNPEDRTAGSGLAILQSLQAMIDTGVVEIHETAARSGDIGGTGYNGYYTWAQLGFTGMIDNLGVERAATEHFGKKITRVEQIMALPGGPAWWKEHGITYHADMDLRPGSPSRAILERFLAIMEKRQARTQQQQPPEEAQP